MIKTTLLNLLRTQGALHDSSRSQNPSWVKEESLSSVTTQRHKRRQKLREPWEGKPKEAGRQGMGLSVWVPGTRKGEMSELSALFSLLKLEKVHQTKPMGVRRPSVIQQRKESNPSLCRPTVHQALPRFL